jgi:UDP-N-acetyl-D-mannosaminuronic acid dehydrogenase
LNIAEVKLSGPGPHESTRLAGPYRDLLIDAGCTVDVHDSYMPEYPGVDISHALSYVVRGADVVAILTGHVRKIYLQSGVIIF